MELRKRLLQGLIAAKIVALSATLAFGGDIVIGNFSGLNSNDSSVSLADNESPDLLNCNITPGGKSVFKRDGYSQYKALPINTSTTAVHGGYHFQDDAGNDIQLWGNAEELTAIVAGATPVAVATGTTDATWQCADSQGNAYCFNTSRDSPVVTDGTSAGTDYHEEMPLGTMAAFTPDRLVVAGVSGSENTLNFSEANQFTSFTVGVQETSPWTEVLASPGSRITHIRWACDKLLYWKDQSFGYVIPDNQFAVTVGIVQPDIGTLDNSSAYYNGHVYFRGQDNHIYDYDCASLTRLSRQITPTIGQSSKRKSNSYSEDTQAEFQTGSIVANGGRDGLSTTIASGFVVPSSYTILDSTNSDFSSGNFSNGIDTTSVSGGFTLSTYVNEDFSSISEWTALNNVIDISGGHAIDGTSGGTASLIELTTDPDPTSDWILQFTVNYQSRCDNLNMDIGIINGDGNIGYGIAVDNDTSDNPYFWLGRIGTYSSSEPSFYDLGTKFTDSSGCNSTDHTIKISHDGLSGATTMYFDGSQKDVYTPDVIYSSFTNIRIDINQATGITQPYLDNVVLVSRKANYTSAAFDTEFSTPIYGSFDAGFNSTGTFSFGYRCSTASVGGYTSDTVISTGAIISGCGHKRFFVYSSTITGTDITNLPIFSSATAVVSSTGTYYSAVHNATNLTSWDTFTKNDTANGGTLTYSVRSSTGSFTILSSTPGWEAQTPDSQVTSSTGTYLQARVDFGITAATQTPTLDKFTFNWFEGQATDKAYIEYWNDGVWISVSSGTGGTNNRILRWDLLNNTWLLDDIAANGLVVDQGSLYFGSPSSGTVYKFGDVTSDAGADINAYWKSKDFLGDDPFVQNEYKSQDFIVKGTTATLTVTYVVDVTTSTSYNLNLYSPTASILRRAKNLPRGAIGGFFNVRFGDDSSYDPWEVLGVRTKYVPLPWRPQ